MSVIFRNDTLCIHIQVQLLPPIAPIHNTRTIHMFPSILWSQVNDESHPTLDIDRGCTYEMRLLVAFPGLFLTTQNTGGSVGLAL